MVDLEKVLVALSACETDTGTGKCCFSDAMGQDRRLVAKIGANNENGILILDIGNVATKPWEHGIVVLIRKVSPLDSMINIGRVEKQNFVVALTPFVSESLLRSADLLLPIGTFAESSGTYVNVAGTWQSFAGIATPVGESRPAWKVLRVIGNLIEMADCDYVTSEDVRDEIAGQLGEVTPDNSYAGKAKFAPPNGEDAPSAEVDTPIYSVDSLVRRATALQLTTVAKQSAGVDKP